ncbi:MAG: sulfatase-like hydrolase/transferase [Chloroflexi bacterium]|nr:sulfatase-like hydrolase/transferase [Chloroflexota bacterium]
MPPNILIYMTDHERGDVLSEGSPCIAPHAARLAEEGISFRQAYTPAAHCCPSRATFMTGLYPSRHGVYNNVLTTTRIHSGLKEGVVTFSERLREVGYHLAYAGKWHVSADENPADRGWEELDVTAVKGNSHDADLSLWREGKAAGDLAPGERQPGEVLRPGWGNYRLYGSYPTAGPKGHEEHRDYAVVRSAIEALPRLADAGQPWVLFVGPSGPHDPYIVPERFVRMYDGIEIPLPPSYHDSLADKPRIYQRVREQVWSQLGPEEVREAIKHYYAYCTMLDMMFGEVLEALAATGQSDDTLVLRISDHGDYGGAHGLFAKGVPAFREAYHVPAIVRWPKGLAQPGRAVEAFVTHADWAPTFLDLAGLAAPERTAGRSVLPILRGETPVDWPDAFHSQFNGVELYYTQRVTMTHQFKYVYNGFDYDELYDLRNDPHEMRNLSEHPGYQGIKRELVKRMWRFADQQRDHLFNRYITVALAPWGPAIALEE